MDLLAKRRRKLERNCDDDDDLDDDDNDLEDDVDDKDNVDDVTVLIPPELPCLHNAHASNM